MSRSNRHRVTDAHGEYWSEGKIARLGLNVNDVQDALSIAVGGREAACCFRGSSI